MSSTRPLTPDERLVTTRTLERLVEELNRTPRNAQSELRAMGWRTQAIVLALHDLGKIQINPAEVIGKDVAFSLREVSAALYNFCDAHGILAPPPIVSSGAASIPILANTLFQVAEKCLGGLAALAEQTAAPINVPVDDTLYKHAAPFIVSRLKNATVCCPGCGQAGLQEKTGVGPVGWSSRVPDGLLQCGLCRNSDTILDAFAESVEYLAAESGAGILSFRERATGLKVGRAVPAETKMKKKEGAVDKKKTLKEQGADLGQAAGLGVAMAATNQSGEVLIDIAKALGNGNPMFEAMLEDPTIRELIKASIALMLYGAAENAPGVMPKPEAIARIAKLQVTWSTAMLSNGGLAKIRPHLMKLAEIGDTLPALSAGTKNELDEVTAEDRVAETVARR